MKNIKMEISCSMWGLMEMVKYPKLPLIFCWRWAKCCGRIIERTLNK
jgi:hypothetical protein